MFESQEKLKDLAKWAGDYLRTAKHNLATQKQSHVQRHSTSIVMKNGHRELYIKIVSNSTLSPFPTEQKPA